MVRSRIEVTPAAVRGLRGLDDLARIVFPDNRRHRRVFVAIWIELKYAEDQFLPSFSALPERYGFSDRLLEIVRAKMRRLGLLHRVSHFSPVRGHAAGWTFSARCAGALRSLATALEQARTPTGRVVDEQKERDSISYV